MRLTAPVCRVNVPLLIAEAATEYMSIGESSAFAHTVASAAQASAKRASFGDYDGSVNCKGQRSPWTSGSATRACARRVSASRWPICCSPRATAISRPRNCTRRRWPRACRSRWRPSTTRCTSSPRPDCCASSRSRGRRPISTPTPRDHHHFFVEGENKVFDIAAGPVRVMQPARAAGGHGDRQCRHRRAAAPQAQRLTSPVIRLMPVILLRIEGAALFAAACRRLTRLSVLLVAVVRVLILAPDLSMLGYLAGPRVGACRLQRRTSDRSGRWLSSLPGMSRRHRSLIGIGADLAGHIAIDRALGYGLKLSIGFPGHASRPHRPS